MNEMRQLICFLGMFSVPVLAFLFSSVLVSWILQSHMISRNNFEFQEIPYHKLTHIATASSLTAVPIAISVGMAWFSNVCLGELRFDFIGPAAAAPFLMLVRSRRL